MPSIHIEKELQAIFQALHASGIFADGKAIADMNMELSPVQMLQEYDHLRNEGDFDIEAFYEAYSEPHQSKPDYVSNPNISVQDHINKLWPYLTRKPKKSPLHSTLIPLPNKYVVPGGRFNEVYYWDSYFTMLGLDVSEKYDLIENMVKNFAWLIDQYGFIPNGNRTYFLTRSQPPFFSHMVDLLTESKGQEIRVHYLPQLIKEHAFWMDHGKETSRVIKLGEHTLNLFGDDSSHPRVEMYNDDLSLLGSTEKDPSVIMTHIRAACESGWDFSSRWFADSQLLESIQTRSIIPVDLNCLLYHLESSIASAAELAKDQESASTYIHLADARKKAILDTFWNEETGYFHDYNMDKKEKSPLLTLAGCYPIFVGIASPEQVEKCTQVIEKHFLKPGGLVTTTVDSGQQWDAPNGWAPLQWITIAGLRKYGHETLASEISDRWIELCTKVYKKTGKLMEKYNVVDIDLESGGGEYPVQDGFGWTNGVLLKLLDMNN